MSERWDRMTWDAELRLSTSFARMRHGISCGIWLFAPFILVQQACQWAQADGAALSGAIECPPPPQPVPPSNLEMAALLAEMRAAQRLDLQDTYLNSARADNFAKLAANSADIPNRCAIHFKQVDDLLKAGRTSEAVPLMESVIRLMNEGAFGADPQSELEIYHMLGIAYLRTGEQTNCQMNHTNESCILPISEKGRHADPKGSRKAVQVYSQILQRFPDDLRSRWLLNVAQMTLGGHPDAIPPQWLIPTAAFGDPAAFPHFEDIATKIGVDLGMDGLAGAASLEDFNGDGFLDIMASSWSLDHGLRLFLNDRDGTFTERSQEAGLTGINGGLNLIHADYDNDGDVDVLMLRGAWRNGPPEPNSLLRNDGKGHFEDVTKAAGLLSYHHTQAGAWGDYDNDGDLDLFVGNESTAEMALPCELFRNNNDGTFTNVAQESGLAMVGYIKGCAWGDVDNDGRIDLYVSDMGAPNKLFMNRGTEATGKTTFINMAKQAGVESPHFGFPTWMFDHDNDGWLDIYASAYDRSGSVSASVAADYLGMPFTTEVSCLYHNNGDGTFTNITKKAGLHRATFAMGCNFGDLDNDGWLDFYLATGDPYLQSIIPNLMFRNKGDGSFEDVTTAGGFGHLQKGHGVAFGDLDNDGDQDIYVTMGGAYEGDGYPNILFHNPGMGNHWTTLVLEGTRSARCAIDARIKVTVETPKGDRDIYATVGTGGSFGTSSIRQEIGLGDATSIRQIEVTWPATHARQVYADVPMDRVVKLVEGSMVHQLVDLPSIRLHGSGNGTGAHMHTAP